MDRRNFIKSIAGLIAISAASCRRPEQKIFSNTESLELMPIGDPVYYHSVYNQFGIPYGISVKVIDSKPIKIDGNINYYANNESTNSLIETELYHLYNPERFYKPLNNNKEIDLNKALELFDNKLSSVLNSDAKIKFIIDDKYSPSTQSMIDLIRKTNSNIEFIVYDRNNISEQLKINQSLFKTDILPICDLTDSKSVLCINRDIIGSDELSLFYSRQIKDNRIKLYNIDNIQTLTSNNSDYNIFANDIDNLISNIFNYYYISQLSPNKELEAIYNLTKNCTQTNESNKIISLLKNNSDIPILIGKYESNRNKKIITIINYYRGLFNEGKPFNSGLEYKYYKNCTYTANLTDKINKNELVISFVDDIFYSEQFKKAINPENTILISEYKSIQNIYLNIPATHFLENWSDTVGINGAYSIIQPVIKPLNTNSISFSDIIFRICKNLNINETAAYNDFYSYLYSNTNDEKLWQELLIRGFSDSSNEIHKFSIFKENLSTDLNISQTQYKSNTEVNIYVREHIYFKSLRDTKNIYLKELIHPVDLTAYYSYLTIDRDFASKNQLKNGDIVKVSNKEISIEIPILISNINLKSKNTVKIDSLINTINSSAYLIDIICLTNASIEKYNKKTGIISETANKLHDFEINYLKKLKEIDKFNVYKSYEYLEKHWGLLVDINKCTGCGACVSACKIENNIPVVSSREISEDKLMNWIDIMQFTDSKGKTRYIPYTCQHCEIASCEIACPVSAAVHSPEGINETVYNRCVGTRYCMAACQYKIRRFNFRDHYKNYPDQLRAILNPNVTVRSVGVVEKCSFCIQRINKYRIADDDKKGQLPQTACQQCCPTNAIRLIDLNDKNTKEFIEANSERIRKIVFGNYTNPSVYYIYD